MSRALPHPPPHQQARLLMKLFADPIPVLDELADTHGPIASMGFGPARMAVIGDPQALREMFALPASNFRWGHKFNVLGFVVGDESMIVSDGDDHKRRRSAVQSAFSRRRLNGWIPTIVEQTDRAIDQLDLSPGASVDIDLYDVGRSLVLNIVVRALFGPRLAERAAEIGTLFQRPQDYLEAPSFKQIPHPFPGTARARVKADREALDAIIDEQVAYLRANPTDDPLNVLEALLQDATLSDSEIRDQVITLIGAGYDTTSASLAWMIWRVSKQDGWWDQLRTEADTTFGPVDSSTAPDDQTLAKLDLANRVMRETTRLHPAGVISPREAAQDLTIGGYSIPKGTLILWSAHLAGRNPAAWPEPERFDPDRFVDLDEEQAEAAKLSWVPFGRGARNCIGFALAQMELTLIISRLAQRLDISTTAAELPKPVGMVVNRPTGGAHMTISLRA